MGSVSQKQSSTLGAIVAHPLRSRCLTILADRMASPAELAIELGENLGNISYHVRALLRAGAVELVDERPVRGAMEHFYKAVVRPCLSDEEFAELSVEQRACFSRQIMSLLTANATTALDVGTFADKADNHVSRVPLRRCLKMKGRRIAWRMPGDENPTCV
jgi:DNA-binding transcriptional ArsR family regulator